jgi:hypothetical protein
MKWLLTALLPVFAACAATTGRPIVAEDEILSLKQTSAKCSQTSSPALEGPLRAEAAAICAGKGRVLKVVDVIERQGYATMRCASVEIQFLCVDGAK